MFTGRVEHGPDTVHAIQHTEVEIQSELDPPASGRVDFTPVGEGRQLGQYPDKALDHRQFNDVWVLSSDTEYGDSRRHHDDQL